MTQDKWTVKLSADGKASVIDRGGNVRGPSMTTPEAQSIVDGHNVSQPPDQLMEFRESLFSFLESNIHKIDGEGYWPLIAAMSDSCAVQLQSAIESGSVSTKN